MTRNQLTYHANAEAARHNRAVEREENRSNLASEAEMSRSNRAKEYETHRSNVRNEYYKGKDVNTRSEEVANTREHYMRMDDETHRANREKERENYRHNVETEAGVRYTADQRLQGQYVKTIGNLGSLFKTN